MKIDPLDYLDSNNKFYIEKPDAFIHFALAQLAGKEHIVKVDEPVYYYNYDPLYFQRQRIKAKKIIARYASNLLVPYQNLQSLDDDAQKV